MGEHVTVDVESLKSMMKGKMLENPLPEMKNSGIYRLPPESRTGDLYDPKLVSIGPLHHGKYHLKAMETFKWNCLQRLLFEFKTMDSDQVLKCLITRIQPLEKRAREEYSKLETCGLPSHEFLMMIILDGCFILYVMWRWWFIRHSSSVSYSQLLRDLLLLENQIPFFVLDELFQQLQHLFPCKRKLNDLAVPCFYDVLDMEEVVDEDEKLDPPAHLLHFYYRMLCLPARSLRSFEAEVAAAEEEFLKELGKKMLLRIRQIRRAVLQFMAKCRAVLQFMVESTRSVLFTFLVSPCICDRILRGKWDISLGEKWDIFYGRLITEGAIPSARQLREVGVEFVRIDQMNQKKIYDVTFDDGKLKIPILYLDDLTKSVLANLRAYEEFLNYDGDDSDHKNTRISTYMWLMFGLIRSTDDANILRDEGIVLGNMGSDTDTVHYFRDACKSKPKTIGSYKLLEDVIRYCNNPTNGWRASLKRNYFSNPWTIFALIASFLGLFLTAVQTFYALPSSQK